MNRSLSITGKTPLLLAGLAAALFSTQAPLRAATVVFQDDFNRNGLSYLYNGTTDVYSSVGLTGATPKGSVSVTTANPYLEMSRIPSSPTGDAAVIANMSAMSTFSTATAGQQLLTVNYDLKVNSFLATNNADNSIRVGLYSGSSSSRLFLGFGEVNVNGTNVNALYAMTSLTGVVTTANLIGYNSTTQTFAPGFDFGLYDTTTAANNFTGLLSVSLSYLNQSTSALLSVTSGGNTASINISTAAVTWSNSTASGSFRSYLPGSGSADFTIDNLNIAAVPEPSPASLVLGALGLFVIVRRVRQPRLAALAIR